MGTAWIRGPLLGLIGLAGCAGTADAQTLVLRGPEDRAVAYLAAEAPRWRREHECYSCHNNGDATRALLAARRAGYDIGPALDDTRVWLRAPDRWEQNARRGGSEELPLGRIQFAAALASMLDSGAADQRALDRAAALVISHQERDGAWRPNPLQLLGGPTSYGTMLATSSARRVLARATSAEAREARALADRWLNAVRVETVLDASGVLLGLDHAAAESAAQRVRAIDLIRRGQGPDGGWGPYVTSPSEAFDTALAILALSRAGAQASDVGDVQDAIARGRAYLIATQEEDGSWAESTRPPGLESYAQRISTSAWALLAVLESGPSSRRGTGW